MSQPTHRREMPDPVLPQVTEREMPDMDAVRARHSNARMAGEHLGLYGWNDESARAALTRSWDDVSDLHDSLRVLAVDVLAMAQAGGMPDSYWHTDHRVDRALGVLGVSVEDAQRIDWTSLPTSR